jgi:hypothetical protein
MLRIDWIAQSLVGEVVELVLQAGGEILHPLGNDLLLKLAAESVGFNVVKDAAIRQLLDIFKPALLKEITQLRCLGAGCLLGVLVVAFSP